MVRDLIVITPILSPIFVAVEDTEDLNNMKDVQRNQDKAGMVRVGFHDDVLFCQYEDYKTNSTTDCLTEEDGVIQTKLPWCADTIDDFIFVFQGKYKYNKEASHVSFHYELERPAAPVVATRRSSLPRVLGRSSNRGRSLPAVMSGQNRLVELLTTCRPSIYSREAIIDVLTSAVDSIKEEIMYDGTNPVERNTDKEGTIGMIVVGFKNDDPFCHFEDYANDTKSSCFDGNVYGSFHSTCPWKRPDVEHDSYKFVYQGKYRNHQSITSERTLCFFEVEIPAQGGVHS
eukprot:Lankesteria_metandrocarpae@DN5382_c0_g1_i11.p1